MLKKDYSTKIGSFLVIRITSELRKEKTDHAIYIAEVTKSGPFTVKITETGPFKKFRKDEIEILEEETDQYQKDILNDTEYFLIFQKKKGVSVQSGLKKVCGPDDKFFISRLYEILPKT